MKILLAHRGVHYNNPENSLNAIINIFNYSSDKFKLGVEFDINLTKDDKLILFHDEKLDNSEIIKLLYDEIMLIDKDIPLLEDVLVHFQNKNYILNIELKDYPESKIKYCDILINLLKKYDDINYFTSTFNIEIYEILQSNNIICYLLSDDNNSLGDIVHYSKITSNSIGVYTLYDANFDKKYLNEIQDIDIIITDDLDKLIEYLSE
jgi:glycerophosphoryl diester phosphodiesterase